MNEINTLIDKLTDDELDTLIILFRLLTAETQGQHPVETR